MKASKQLQKQFADFKAEFIYLCASFGGVRNPKGETAGEGSAWLIPCQWGNLHASIQAPWDYEGQLYPHHRNYSSAAIYLQFRDNTGDCPFSLSGEFNRHSHKWNIHCSVNQPRQFNECANAALLEFSRRLEKVTGKKEYEVALGFDLKGGSGSLGLVRGELVADMRELKVGDLLINDCRQFDATNVIRIAQTVCPPHEPGEVVRWQYHGRADSAPEHSLWHWDLARGEYRRAINPKVN